MKPASNLDSIFDTLFDEVLDSNLATNDWKQKEVEKNIKNIQ